MKDRDAFCFLKLFGNIDDRFIEETEISSRYTKTTHFHTIKRIAAAVIILLLTGTIALSPKTVTAGLKYIVSAIVEILGISEDALQYTDVIGKTITQNGLSITLCEVILDEDQMIVSYDIKSDDPEKADPLLINDTQINDHKVISNRESSEGFESTSKYNRKVVCYRYSKDYMTNDPVEISIILRPENMETGIVYGEFKFEFEASAADLKKDTVHVPLTTKLEIDSDGTIQLKEFTYNVVHSDIIGICANLPDNYRGENVEYYLKGKDNLGNPVSYWLNSYINPDVNFTLEEGESMLSPTADSVSLQLYGKFLQSLEGSVEEDFVDVEEDTEDDVPADFELNDYTVFTENPYELFPIGEPFEIKIREE